MTNCIDLERTLDASKLRLLSVVIDLVAAAPFQASPDDVMVLEYGFTVTGASAATN